MIPSIIIAMSGGGGAIDMWILSTGIWNDYEYWDDSKFWKD